MRKWAKVAAVAQRQHLLITVWQLRVLGVTDAELKERLDHHGWRRLTHGVIALPGPDTDRRKLAVAVLAYSRPTGAAQRVADKVSSQIGAEKPPEQGTTQRGTQGTKPETKKDAKQNAKYDRALVDALVELAIAGGQVVTGASALWLYGISAKPSTHLIRLTKVGGHGARKGVGLRLGPVCGTITRIDGLPVVDVEQAIVDAAPADPDETALHVHHRLTRLIATADAKRATTVDRLESRVRTMGRFVGRPALLRALKDLRGELSHSGTERKARQAVASVLAKYGHVLHPRPYAVKLGTRTVGEADLAVLSICLDFEIDGPHHLLPQQREKDQLRDRRMRRARWEVERFSTELVDLRPVTFAAQVEECVRFRLGLDSTSDSPA